MNKSIELDPTSHETFFLRGFVFSPQKEYKKAEADFSNAIRLKPDKAGIYYNRAVVCCLCQDYRKAAKDANQAKAMGYEVPQEFLDQIQIALNMQL